MCGHCFKNCLVAFFVQKSYNHFGFDDSANLYNIASVIILGFELMTMQIFNIASVIMDCNV